MGVEVTGPAARDVWRLFEVRWDEAVAAENTERLQYFPFRRAPEPLEPPRRYNPQTTDPALTRTDALPVERVVRATDPEHQAVVVARSFPELSGVHPPHRWHAPELARGHTDFRDVLCRAMRVARSYVYIEDQDAFQVFAQSPEHERRQLSYLTFATTLGLVPPIPLHVPYPPFAEALATAIAARPQLKVIFVTVGNESDVQDRPANTVRPELSAFAAAHPRNVAVLLRQNAVPHAKVVLIDDYFFSIGSANFATRSAIGIDTECQMGVTEDRDDHQPNTVKALRIRLWGEHLGLPDDQAARQLDDPRAATREMVPAWGGRTGPPSDGWCLANRAAELITKRHTRDPTHGRSNTAMTLTPWRVDLRGAEKSTVSCAGSPGKRRA